MPPHRPVISSVACFEENVRATPHRARLRPTWVRLGVRLVGPPWGGRLGLRPFVSEGLRPAYVLGPSLEILFGPALRARSPGHLTRTPKALSLVKEEGRTLSDEPEDELACLVVERVELEAYTGLRTV